MRRSVAGACAERDEVLELSQDDSTRARTRARGQGPKSRCVRRRLASSSVHKWRVAWVFRDDGLDVRQAPTSHCQFTFGHCACEFRWWSRAKERKTALLERCIVHVARGGLSRCVLAARGACQLLERVQRHRVAIHAAAPYPGEEVALFARPLPHGCRQPARWDVVFSGRMVGCRVECERHL